jgi:hypothetical protein
MAKKSRKARARRAPRMYPKGAPTSSTARARPREDQVPEEEPEVETTLTSSELRDEYWYVYNDLKRIATIAGVLFGLLIVLAFVI